MGTQNRLDCNLVSERLNANCRRIYLRRAESRTSIADEMREGPVTESTRMT